MSETKKLTEDELIDMSVRLRKATRGNWMPSPATSVLGSGVVSAPTGRVVAMGVASDDDAEFIAHAHTDIERLLHHIAAMEAEQRAGASRTASDAFRVGVANMNFNERQTQRIQELEVLINEAEAALSPLANREALSEEKCNRAANAVFNIQKYRADHYFTPKDKS